MPDGRRGHEAARPPSAGGARLSSSGGHGHRPRLHNPSAVVAFAFAFAAETRPTDSRNLDVSERRSMERMRRNPRRGKTARVSALGGHPAGADDGGGAAGDDAAREPDGLRAVCVGAGVVVVAAEEVAEAEGRLDAVVVGGAGAECGEPWWGRHAVGWGGGWFVGVGVGVG